MPTTIDAQKRAVRTRTNLTWPTGFMSQRHHHRTHQLRPGQLELLNTVPGWYQPTRDEKEARAWEEHLEAVTAYMAIHGLLPTYRKGPKDLRNTLAGWIWAQRRQQRDGILPQTRQDRLDTNVPRWRSKS